MSNKDTLGDRIKRYEAVSNNTLTPRTPVFIRVDGKAFHTFTRGLNKPFDLDLIDSMVYAAKMTAKEMQGFKLAYIQSDEATFMLTDYSELETQPWFGYEINKLVSITASLFTYHFRKSWVDAYNSKYIGTTEDEFNKEVVNRVSLFDARAFNVPEEDAPNVFIWRQRDWERNSVQMLARSLYSQKELHGKKVPELHDLIHAKGQNWAHISDQLKNGTFIKADGKYSFAKHTYDTLKEIIEGVPNE